MTEEAQRYKITKVGTGHSPHELVNVDNPQDSLSLCSCGGTQNSQGHCDGTHNKKKGLGCPCWYCKEHIKRQTEVFDKESKCGS